MSKLIIPHIIRFLVIMLLQIMLFNYLNIFGYVNPAILIFFIILIPFETSAWLFLILAFLTGLTQDSFLNTGGIHTAAATLIAFVRPFLLRLIASKREFESGVTPSASDLGWKWFLNYSAIMILIYSIMTEFLLVFRLNHFFDTLIRVFWQALFTLLFVLIFEFVRSLNKQKPVI